MHAHSGGRAVSVSALAITLVAAATSAAGRPVSLPEAEDIALQRNPAISLASDSLARAYAGVVGARARLLPSVSLNGSYTHNFESPVFFFPGDSGAPSRAVKVGQANQYAFGLSAAQPLFLGFAGITGYRMAETQVRTAEIGQDDATQRVIEGVREAYLGAVLMRKLVDVQREAVAQAESSLVQTRRRFDVGTVSRFDLLRAQVQLATTRPNLLSAIGKQELADAQLRQAMGLGGTETVEPADTLAEFASPWLQANLDSLVQLAYRNRPDMRQVGYLDEMARYGVRLARSAYLPTLAIGAQSQWQASRPEVMVRPHDFVRSISGGLQLSWNIWNSFGTAAAVQQANVGVRQVASVTRLVQNATALQVESAYRQLQDAAARLTSGQETVGQAAEALRIARVMYAAGGNTQLDVTNAQLLLTQAQTQYVSALYDYHVANTRMERALGLVRPSQQRRSR